MKHKKLLTNLLFAAVVLAIAAVLLLVRNAHSSGSKLRAELIYGDNNTTMNLPLDKNDTYRAFYIRKKSGNQGALCDQ